MGPLSAPDSPLTRLAWDAASSGMGYLVLGGLVVLVLVWVWVKL